MNLAEFSIRNRLFVWIAIIASLIGGWIAYESMPRFEDPEFTIRTAQIYTSYPGATPREVADEVTDELESAIQQMKEVEEIRSVSADGYSLVSVDILYEFSRSKSDLDGVWSKLRNKVDDAQTALPPGAETSIVNDDFGDVYGLYYAVTGDGFTEKELLEYAQGLRQRLLAVEDVAKVAIGGDQPEAIFVEISRDKARAFGLSINQIFQDLSQQNSVVAAGDMVVDGRRLKITPTGEADSVSALENIIISTPESGTILRLRDVANVTRGYIEPARFQLRYNGKTALSLGVSNVPGSNVVALSDRIEEALQASFEDRPIGIEVHEFYNQGKVVDASVRDFALNVVIALVIVVGTLLLFMGYRAAITIGATLILTIAATLAVMNAVGIPMHRISLGALIIALGMLVDNAIVVTEGIIVGVAKGRKLLEIAKDVVSRTQWPLLGGTIVGALAFAPIGFASGSTAEYTNHLFWVVLISLLFSWVFAITVVPFLASLIYKQHETDEEAEHSEGPVEVRYKALIRSLLKIKWIAIGATVSVFAVAIWGFQFVKSGFFPASTTPQIVIDYWLPEGVDISLTRENLAEIESFISEQEGVDAVHTMVGAGTLRYMLIYNPESGNSAYGQILVKVDDFNRIAGLLPTIQNHIDTNYLDAQAKVWRYTLGPGGGSKIEVQFTGPDPAVLRRLANRAKEIMASDLEAIAIKDDWRQPAPVIEPVYNASLGRRLGVSREDFANALQFNYTGRSIGAYREGDDLLPIISRAPEAERLGPENLASIQVTSAVTGRSVPIIELVDTVNTVWRDARILRVDRTWTIQAQCDPAEGVLADDLLTRLKPRIEAIDLPNGYALKWNGEAGDSAEAQSSLAAAIPMGLIAMVLTVVFLFNAVRQPLLIWLTVPLALIGVVLGLLVTNSAMEFMAILGLLSLSGLLIKNAIVLVDQMDTEIREGKPRFDAVVDSAYSRVRPVMMGSLTTVLGIIPLFGDAFFKSMAVVLAFGLSFATLLTLLIVPVLYALMFGIHADESALNLQGDAE